MARKQTFERFPSVYWDLFERLIIAEQPIELYDTYNILVSARRQLHMFAKLIREAPRDELVRKVKELYVTRGRDEKEADQELAERMARQAYAVACSMHVTLGPRDINGKATLVLSATNKSPTVQAITRMLQYAPRPSADEKIQQSLDNLRKRLGQAEPDPDTSHEDIMDVFMSRKSEPKPEPKS